MVLGTALHKPWHAMAKRQSSSFHRVGRRSFLSFFRFRLQYLGVTKVQLVHCGPTSQDDLGCITCPNSLMWNAIKMVDDDFPITKCWVWGILHLWANPWIFRAISSCQGALLEAQWLGGTAQIQTFGEHSVLVRGSRICTHIVCQSIHLYPYLHISPYLYLSHSISISISTRLLHTSHGPPLLSNLLPWEWIQTQAPHGPGRTCWCTFEALEPMTASLWKSQLLYSWIFGGTNLQMGGLLPSYAYIYIIILSYIIIYIYMYIMTALYTQWVQSWLACYVNVLFQEAECETAWKTTRTRSIDVMFQNSPQQMPFSTWNGHSNTQKKNTAGMPQSDSMFRASNGSANSGYSLVIVNMASWKISDLIRSFSQL